MNFNVIHRQLFLFIFFILILNIIQAITLPLIDDEAYYWVWSNNLDFGYYDHPPMVALFIKLGYYIFPSILGVRLLSIIANIIFIIIWYKILKPKTIQHCYLFIALFGSAAIFQAMGFISTPDVPLMLFGTYFILKWKNFLKDQNLINSILLGISMALTMYSKYFGALLIIFAIIPHIKYLFKNIWLLISILIALILFAPHLYWQYNHDWVSIKYHLFGRNKKEVKGFLFGEWILGLLIVLNPLLIYFYAKSLFFKNSKKWLKSLKSIIICTFILFAVTSFKIRIQPQWNLIIILALIPLVYRCYRYDSNNKTLLKLSFIYIVFILVMRILFLFPFFYKLTPMYDLKSFVLKAKTVTKGIAVFERYQKASLYNFYNQKEAECIQVYNHRKSQYDIWNSEKKIQNQKITFFRLEQISNDFIENKSKKNEYYKTIDKYKSYSKINCIVNPKQYVINNDLIKFNIKWFNPYNEDLILSKDSNLEAGIILCNSKTLNPVIYLSFNEKSKLIKGINNIEIKSIYIQNILKGEYKCYVILKFFGLSAKTISNEFIIE